MSRSSQVSSPPPRRSAPPSPANSSHPQEPEMTNDNDPYLMIAADSHAGLPTEQYRTYLESRFHDAFDGFLTERAAVLEAVTKLGVRNEEYAKQWYEEHDDELAG